MGYCREERHDHKEHMVWFAEGWPKGVKRRMNSMKEREDIAMEARRYERWRECGE